MIWGNPSGSFTYVKHYIKKKKEHFYSLNVFSPINIRRSSAPLFPDLSCLVLNHRANARDRRGYIASCFTECLKTPKCSDFQ